MIYDIGNKGSHQLPFKYTRDKRGNCSAMLEDLWSGAKVWAEQHGGRLEPSYGIVDRDGKAIAPT